MKNIINFFLKRMNQLKIISITDLIHIEKTLPFNISNLKK